MPTKRHKRIARRARAGELTRAQVLYLQSGFDILDGATAFNGDDLGRPLRGEARDKHILGTWRRHGAIVLSEHIAELPCTRPWAWWAYDAPKPRLRLYSPDFLCEINEPEAVYLERTSLLQDGEMAAAGRAQYAEVLEDERQYWERCIAHSKGKKYTCKPTSKLVRLTRERNAHDLKQGHRRGIWFDEMAADRAVAAINLLAHHSKGQWGGKPFRLSAWQEYDLIRPVFGWMKLPDGITASQAAALPYPDRLDSGIYRRFRTAYTEICRKNGKSTLLSAVAWYLVACDREPGAEVYSAATKRDQAKIVHGEAVRMRLKSPHLRAISNLRKTDSTLELPDTGSVYRPLGADHDTLDGLNSHGNLIDELHAHKTDLVYDKLATGEGSRRQPLLWVITTAGAGREGVCWRERSYGVGLLENYKRRNGQRDDTYYALIYGLDDGDDMFDQSVWIKANPNLGISVKLDYLQRRSKKARHDTKEKNTWARMHCGRWTEQHDTWLNMTKWQRCGGTVDWDQYKQVGAMAGLDLGSTSDLTSLCLVWPRQDADGFVMRWWNWIPKEKALEMDIKHEAHYEQWAERGDVSLTDGEEIDYTLIQKEIETLYEEWTIQEITVDRLFQGAQLCQQLQRAGLTLTVFPQSFYGMAAPSVEFERLVNRGELRHGDNALVEWCASKCMVEMDPAGNIRPSKKLANRVKIKIDPIVSAVMALGRWMVTDPEAGRSVYEERGVLWI